MYVENFIKKLKQIVEAYKNQTKPQLFSENV